MHSESPNGAGSEPPGEHPAYALMQPPHSTPGYPGPTTFSGTQSPHPYPPVSMAYGGYVPTNQQATGMGYPGGTGPYHGYNAHAPPMAGPPPPQRYGPPPPLGSFENPSSGFASVGPPFAVDPAAMAHMYQMAPPTNPSDPPAVIHGPAPSPRTNVTPVASQNSAATLPPMPASLVDGGTLSREGRSYLESLHGTVNNLGSRNDALEAKVANLEQTVGQALEQLRDDEPAQGEKKRKRVRATKALASEHAVAKVCELSCP